VRLKDQHHAEKEDAQSQKFEKMVLHPSILADGGAGVMHTKSTFAIPDYPLRLAARNTFASAHGVELRGKYAGRIYDNCGSY
jgi:hypothetical protein